MLGRKFACAALLTLSGAASPAWAVPVPIQFPGGLFIQAQPGSPPQPNFGQFNTGTLLSPGFMENLAGSYDPATGDILVENGRLIGSARDGLDPTADFVPTHVFIGTNHGLPASTGTFTPGAGGFPDSFFDIFLRIEFQSPGTGPTLFNLDPLRLVPDTSGSADPALPFSPGTLWMLESPPGELYRTEGGTDVVHTEILELTLGAPGVQEIPGWPSATIGGGFLFEDMFGRFWYDPPFTDGYIYSMVSDSLFTGILDFPVGFDSPFEVWVDGSLLGLFGPGDSVDFTGFPGGGVSEFTIQGISPLADIEDPAAFPIQLEFNTDTASFTMIDVNQLQIPEPSSAILLVCGAGVAAASCCRRRRMGVVQG